jgi:hypothetical protein
MENEIKNYSNLSNTQKDFQMYLKNTGENYKTSKSYQFMSSFHKTSNQLYNRRARALILNPKNYDSDSLKQQLNNCKTMIHEQKATILNFKIKYGKLYNENMNNKNLISNVLGTPLEQYLTKEEVLDKIENVKLTKGERNILNEAYECILLKYEIEGKKERNKKSAKYLKELIDNSKVKKINEMVNEYLEKCEEQRKILRKLKSIEEATILIESENVILEQSLEKEKKTKNEIQKKKLNKRDNYEELIEERSNLSHQNKLLIERIKKTIKQAREKTDKIRLIETQLKEIEINCQDIDEYKTERDSKIKKLDEKKLSDEEIRKDRKDQENIIKQLNSEYEQLGNKMSNYLEEKPKLLKKAKEPKSDIDNMKKLESTLKELKAERENQNKLHEEKQAKLKNIDEAERDNDEKNKKIIEQNNLTKDNMNKKIDELNTKFKELSEKFKNDSNNFENIKIEYEKLLNDEKKLKETIEANDIENENEKKKKDDERKKEINSKRIHHQKELDSLKRENNKLKDQNQRYQKEIDDIQQEENDFDAQLNSYNDIEQQLKDAQDKLKSLKE